MVHAMAAEKRREQLSMVLVGAEVGRGHKSKVIQGRHTKKGLSSVLLVQDRSSVTRYQARVPFQWFRSPGAKLFRAT
jgi:hypothetical protein